MSNEAYILDFPKQSMSLSIGTLWKDQLGNQSTVCKEEGLQVLSFCVCQIFHTPGSPAFQLEQFCHILSFHRDSHTAYRSISPQNWEAAPCHITKPMTICFTIAIGFTKMSAWFYAKMCTYAGYFLPGSCNHINTPDKGW